MILRLQSEEIQDGNIPVILDINEIASLLGSLKLKDRRTKHRIKMKLLTLFDTEENRNVFFTDDNSKYTELISRLI
jgi:hypothetical protein